MTRDQIALALQQQQRQGAPGRPLGSPFAPAPTLQGPPPVAGTPNAPIAAAIPQYGFETGFKAGAGPQTADTSKEDTLKKLMQLMATGGSGAP
jgi:hypothetical protein